MHPVAVAFRLCFVVILFEAVAEETVDEDILAAAPKDDVAAEVRLEDVIEKLSTRLNELKEQSIAEQQSNETSFCDGIELQASGLASSFAEDDQDHGASWAVGEVMREITWLCEGGRFRDSDADFQAHAKGMHEVLLTLMDSMQCQPGMVACGRGGNVVGHKPNCTCACQLGWTGADCSQPICAETCGEHGFCVGPNDCKCEEDWIDASPSTDAEGVIQMNAAHVESGESLIQVGRRHLHHHHRHSHHHKTNNLHTEMRHLAHQSTPTTTKCSVHLSYSWQAGQWSECNSTERGTNGSQTRSVACHRSDGVVLKNIVTECTTARCAEGCVNNASRPNASQACCKPLRKEDFPETDCGKEEDGCGGVVDFGACMALGNGTNASSRFGPVMKLLKGLLSEAQEALKGSGDPSHTAFCQGMERKIHGFQKQVVAETQNESNSSVSDPHLWALNEAARELEWLCHSNWADKPRPEQKRILKAHKDMLLEVYDAYVEAQDRHIAANKDTESNATKYLRSYWETTKGHNGREPWKSMQLGKRRSQNCTDFCPNLTSAACGVSPFCHWDEDDHLCKDPHQVAAEAEIAQQEAGLDAQAVVNATPPIDDEPDFLPPSSGNDDGEWWPENKTRIDRDGWKYTPWGREEVGGPEERKSRMEEEKRRKEKERQEKLESKKKAEEEAERRKRQRPPQCPPCPCSESDLNIPPLSSNPTDDSGDGSSPLSFLNLRRAAWRSKASKHCPRCNPCPSESDGAARMSLQETHLVSQVGHLTEENHELRASLEAEQQAIAGLATEVASLRARGSPSTDPQRSQAQSWRNLWNGMESLSKRNPLSLLRRLVAESPRYDMHEGDDEGAI